MAPLFQLPARWPLVPVDVAAFYLNRPPEEVARVSDSLWAWDISASDGGRRQLRLWRDSLIALKNPGARVVVPGQVEQVIDRFLPRRDLRGTELQQLLFCHRNLIRDLVRARCLKPERRRRASGGTEASPVFHRVHVRRFLIERTVGLQKPAITLHPAASN